MSRLHVVCVLVGLVGFSSQAEQTQGVPKKTPAREGKPTSQSERQQYPTENSPLPIRVVESPSDEADRKRREAEAAKHEEADLDAQVRSADAAEKQVAIGRATAWLSLFGLCALIWTLCETRRSVSAANRAAAAAEGSVTAFLAASEKELRAYVTVESVSVTWRNEPDDVTIKPIRTVVVMRNSGQTPATNFSVRAHAYDMPADATVFADSGDPIGSIAVVGPTQTAHSDFTAQINSIFGVVNRWRAGTHTIFVWGEIRYVDVFKKQRWTKFRYFMAPPGDQTPDAKGNVTGRFSACAGGNEMDQT